MEFKNINVEIDNQQPEIQVEKPETEQIEFKEDYEEMKDFESSEKEEEILNNQDEIEQNLNFEISNENISNEEILNNPDFIDSEEIKEDIEPEIKITENETFETNVTNENKDKDTAVTFIANEEEEVDIKEEEHIDASEELADKVTGEETTEENVENVDSDEVRSVTVYDVDGEELCKLEVAEDGSLTEFYVSPEYEISDLDLHDAIEVTSDAIDFGIDNDIDLWDKDSLNEFKDKIDLEEGTGTADVDGSSRYGQYDIEQNGADSFLTNDDYKFKFDTSDRTHPDVEPYNNDPVTFDVDNGIDIDSNDFSDIDSNDFYDEVDSDLDAFNYFSNDVDVGDSFDPVTIDDMGIIE